MDYIEQLHKERDKFLLSQKSSSRILRNKRNAFMKKIKSFNNEDYATFLMQSHHMHVSFVQKGYFYIDATLFGIFPRLVDNSIADEKILSLLQEWNVLGHFENELFSTEAEVDKEESSPSALFTDTMIKKMVIPGFRAIGFTVSFEGKVPEIEEKEKIYKITLPYRRDSFHLFKIFKK